ncbi:MAG: hypothetical protein JWQ10_2391 [Herbaspirillum sp.]|jgi:hypothetical protein|nr:hypothetical protein [Herbaspirillum sp.]
MAGAYKFVVAYDTFQNDIKFRIFSPILKY